MPATRRFAVLPVSTRSPPTVLPNVSAAPSAVAPTRTSRLEPVTDRVPPTTAPATFTPQSESAIATSPLTPVCSRSTYVAACVVKPPPMDEPVTSTSRPPAATLPPTSRSLR